MLKKKYLFQYVLIIMFLSCICYLAFPYITKKVDYYFLSQWYMIGKVYIAIPLLYSIIGIFLGILIISAIGNDKEVKKIRILSIIIVFVVVILFVFKMATSFKFNYFVICHPYLYTLLSGISYLIIRVAPRQ